jgi:translation initiation factor IF-2
MTAERTKSATKSTPTVENRTVQVPPILTVRELATLMKVSPIDVIKELMNNGIMANINQQIDFDTAAIVGTEMGFEVMPEVREAEEAAAPEEVVPMRERFIAGEDPSKLKLRPPVVTVLGHVDHGKTTLLDAIRETNVVAGEAGGITQHIGAYQVDVAGRKITFLDTPGHEAFTAMRARGAQVTDLVILVVAADDGVMPQTREAIDHARAARVPIMVALNKIDKSNANPDRVKQELADVGLVVEDWGGDVICVPVSAKQRQGIDELLENVLLVTEVAELKANPDHAAQGAVIEGEIDERRGVTATLLVQNGTLHVGDLVVIGEEYGKVRAMFNDRGERVREAGPSIPVAILGLPEVPKAGDYFEVVDSERAARDIVSQRASARLEVGKQQQGSIDPIVRSLKDLGDEGLKVRVLRQGAGNISESDIMLAVASSAIVVGFQVEIDSAAQRLADAEGVDVRRYDIIYKLIDDIDKALKGLLEPTFQDVVIGHAEVRAVFRIPRKGNIAGSYVLDGRVTRNGLARVRRNGDEIYNGKVSSLKRFTEDVREVGAGYECGIGVEGFNDFHEGDVIEVYAKEQVT